jgi:hypothetical protein
VASLARKIEAEKQMRDLLQDAGLPEPDHVEYGFNCIRLFFNRTRHVVIIDLDEHESEHLAVDPDVA